MTEQTGKEDEKKVVQQEVLKSANFLDNKYTFESFVAGSSNQFARAASLAVGNGPGKLTTPFSYTAELDLVRPIFFAQLGIMYFQKK